MEHLDDHQLTEYAAGALSAGVRLEVNQHLELCAACRDRLRELSDFARGSTLVAGSRAPDTVRDGPRVTPSPAAADSLPLDRGTSLGRYVLLDRLGAGGMGEVFAAFDPQLDRKVALKLLRGGVLAAEEGRHRLLREAQAMARLAHPNVIAVHDVGTFEDRVFVAMEFVDGDTLTHWLRVPRPWQAVLEMFLAAGRGLAAAHHAGLVHRDFKPDNVLIGREDGRPRVLDFGLARQVDPAANPFTPSVGAQPGGRGATPSPGQPISQNALDTPLTQAGAVMGTPGYMSLEQLQGQPTDARTDQFSFCVALHEALYGKRPFGGTTVASHSAEIIKGELPPAPDNSQVPQWVRSVLLRGLSAAPGNRFDSMDALLSALTRDRRRGRTRILATAAALALLGVGSAVWSISARRHTSVCSGMERKLTGIWDTERKQAVHAAFAATDKPYAEDAWRGVERALDVYARSWVAQSTQSCESSRVQRVDSDEVFALRTLCLDDHLKELQALVDLYAQADADVLTNAVSSARSLADLRGCADLTALTAHRKSDPATREAREGVHGKLIAAKALHDSGKYAKGVGAATAAAVQAKALGDRALEAEASFLLGRLQDKAGDARSAERTLFEAGLAAEAAREDELAVRSWSRLAVVSGAVLARPETGRQWSRLAQAAMERLGKNEGVEADLEGHLGSLALFEKKNEEALAHFNRSLDLRSRALGADHPELAIVFNNVGVALARLGRTGEALTSQEKALELHRRTLGDDHPNVASSLNNVGVLHLKLGDFDKAEARYQQALRIREKTLDAQHPEIAASEQSLGNLFLKRGRLDEALVHHRRALTIREKVYGREHPLVAESLNNLGDVSERRDDHAQALSYYQAALDTYSKKLAADHPSISSARENLGIAYEGLKQFDKAQAELDLALAMRVKALGAEHVDVARTYKLLGELASARGNPEKALIDYQRALAIRERSPGDSSALSAILLAIGRTHVALKNPTTALPSLERAVALREKSEDETDLAEARYLLALAIWDGKTDPNRAIALATQARDGYARVGEHDRANLAQVEAWLAKHAAAAAKESP